MSWYQFQGAVQGGYGGEFDDDEHRRRRKHYRDAGAPYTGGASSGGPLEEGGGGSAPFREKIPDYWTEVAAKPGGVPDPIGPGVQPPPSPPQPDRGPPEVGVPGPRIDPPTEIDPQAGGSGRLPRRPAPRQAAAMDLGDGPSSRRPGTSGSARRPRTSRRGSTA